MTRADAARRFAEAMGWEYGSPGLGDTWIRTGEPGPSQGLLYLPPADDALHSHLAFVGRVAETLGLKPTIEPFQKSGWSVMFDDAWSGVEGEQMYGADLSWAALLAAVAAKEGTK